MSELEWFVSRQEGKLIIEKWRRFYKNERPHSAPGNRTPAAVDRERRQEQAACSRRLTIAVVTN